MCATLQWVPKYSYIGTTRIISREDTKNRTEPPYGDCMTEYAPSPENTLTAWHDEYVDRSVSSNKSLPGSRLLLHKTAYDTKSRTNRETNTLRTETEKKFLFIILPTHTITLYEEKYENRFLLSFKCLKFFQNRSPPTFGLFLPSKVFGFFFFFFPGIFSSFYTIISFARNRKFDKRLPNPR